MEERAVEQVKVAKGDSYARVKAACYMTNVSMSVVSNLSPLLFIIFRSQFGLSYSLLGLLVLINFCTQLIVDLIFSFFSHKFNIAKTVKITPILAVIGLVIYALFPYFLPHLAYLGIVIGTVIFSAAGGLVEVLISPVIAAIPADDPDKEISKLHSVYAWGVVGVVLFGTLFLLLFGASSWTWLTLLFAIIPLVATMLYQGANIPKIKTPAKTSGAISFLKNKGVWLCFFAIFFGGASECIMAQWSSGYIEQALGIPKVWGDVFGVTLFSLALGLGRTIYSKKGKNICKVLLLGAIGACACYLVAALSPIPIIALIACALTGFCVSMLWPGSLIVSSDRYAAGGVFIFALMAAGGDFGASVGPQLVGVVSDLAITSSSVASLAATVGLNVEQLAMKIGMLTGVIFPLLAVLAFSLLYRGEKKKKGLLPPLKQEDEVEK